jgi:carbon storage regulator CsrA
MLTLTRKVDEGITLYLPDGTTIEVYVSRITPKLVRLSFVAPDAVEIVRNELIERLYRDDD